MTATDSTSATKSVAGFPDGVEGVTPPTSPEGTGGFLSDVIVELGFVDRETVEQAVEAARQPGLNAERILLENGVLTEQQLSRALAERHGLDHVDLDRFEVDMRAASLINRDTGLRYRAVPIAFATDGALIVAIADPVDALAISDLEVMTRTETRRAVASGSSIDALAERLPEVGARQPRSSPATESPADPDPSGSSSAASTADPPVGEFEAATDETGLRAQEASRPLDPPPTSNGSPDRKGAEAGAETAALEAELAEFAKMYDLLREQAAQAEADRGRLREQVEEAAQERDRLREALDQVSQERDRLQGEARKQSAESASLAEQAGRAQSTAEEATRRIRELEEADRRADAARVALNELREESEREREQSSRLERKLREELTIAKDRIASLELRLSGLLAVAAKAKTMAEQLMALHDEITDDDIASEDDGAPSATPTEPQTPPPAEGAGGPGHGGSLPPQFQKPTI